MSVPRERRGMAAAGQGLVRTVLDSDPSRAFGEVLGNSVAVAPEPDDRLLSIKEAADYCGVKGSSTIRSALWRGAIVSDGTRPGRGMRQHLFRRSTLDAWRERLTVPEGYLQTREAAKYCRVDHCRLSDARMAGELPSREYVPSGGGLAYIFLQADLDRWAVAYRLALKEKAPVAPSPDAFLELVEARLERRRLAMSRRRARERGALVAEVRHCRSCVFCVPEQGRFVCGAGNWERSLDQAAVLRLPRAFAADCADYERKTEA